MMVLLHWFSLLVNWLRRCGATPGFDRAHHAAVLVVDDVAVVVHFTGEAIKRNRDTGHCFGPER
jgi:hypothetical protein